MNMTTDRAQPGTNSFVLSILLRLQTFCHMIEVICHMIEMDSSG